MGAPGGFILFTPPSRPPPPPRDQTPDTARAIRSLKCFLDTKSSTLAWSLVSGLFNPATKWLCGRGSQFRSPLSANATDDAVAAESVLEAIPI